MLPQQKSKTFVYKSKEGEIKLRSDILREDEHVTFRDKRNKIGSLEERYQISQVTEDDLKNFIKK